MRKTEHKLKCIDIYWDAIASGEKTFEVRRNDRAFQTGDTLILRKIDAQGYNVAPPGEYSFTESLLRKRITYILQGGQFGIEPAYCVLGLGEVT
jgi:hypothetical protein